MGVSIRLYAEVREADGRWRAAGEWVPNPYAESAGEPPQIREEFYTGGRNYFLFAVLGYAYLPHFEQVVPASPLRGLPKDVSEEIRRESEKEYPGGHHSWLTVQELLEYDWTRRIGNSGLVNFYGYRQWRNDVKCDGCGVPREWFAYAAKNVINVLAMEALVQKEYSAPGSSGNSKDELENTYTRLEWEAPVYMYAERFLARTLPRLWQLGSPANVRIVFWFDQ